MNLSSFFAELKRRNVYKVAVAYAVVSWLLIQAASILFPTFEAPPWVMKVFVVVLVLGFVPALIFAWAFEITPEGIKRESEVAPNESITHHTGRKILALTIVVAIIAAGLLAFQLHPAFSYAHWHYGEMLQVSGDLKGAAAEYAKASTVSNTPEPIALTGQLAARMGRPEEARRALTALDEMEKRRYVDVFWRALLYLSLGDKEQALQSLEQSYANGEGYEIGLIKVDPMLDSLRTEPRFQALVKKVRGLKEEAKL